MPRRADSSNLDTVGAAAEMAAIARMIDEGGPVRWAGVARTRKHLRSSAIKVAEELPLQERLTERRAALRRFRLYCFACGRSTTVEQPPARPGWCTTCGGTMLTELEAS